MLDPATDALRKTRTIGRVFEVLRDEQWHDLKSIATATGDNPRRVSSRIRDLRLAEYGGYKIEKQVVDKTTQLWKYRLDLEGKQVTPTANAPVVAAPVAVPAKPVGTPAVVPGVAVVPGKQATMIKFFNTNSFKSELISKDKCRVEPDGPYKRVVAVDDTGNAIPHLVTTASDL